MSDIHFYEPSAGHGLAHDPLNAIVAPRPIGWVSTQAADGTLNLAPYSFFNLFNYKPPILGFCSLRRKDSLSNVEANGEFVWNLATRSLADAVNRSSAPAPADVDEFKLAGLTPEPSRLVKVPRVKETPVAFECKVTQIVRLKGKGGEDIDAWLVLGEAVGIHIRRDLIVDGVYDTAGGEPILRGGGPTSFFGITRDNEFHLDRPNWP